MPGAVITSAPLLVAAGLSFLIYSAVYQAPAPLGRLWQYARLDYAWLTDYSLAGQLAFIGGFFLLFTLYALSLRLLWREPGRGGLPLVLSIQAILSLALLDMYPAAALDLYDYLLYGRLGLYWGANPLAHPPSEFPGEPLVAYSYWPNEPSVYGPLWQLVSLAVTAAVEGRLPDGMYAFKILAIASALLTSGLIWAAARVTQPALAAAAAAAYAWNPLQIYETAGNGHNDTPMAAFLALALLLAAHRKDAAALLAVTAGLLIKITLAPLVPLFIVIPVLRSGSLRSQLLRAAIGAALALLLATILYAPFWEGRATLAFLDRGNWFTASPPTLLRELLRRWLEYEAAGRLAATVCATSYALYTVGVLGPKLYRAIRTRYSPLPLDAAHLAYQFAFAYLVVACLWWQPWYLLMLLVPAALTFNPTILVRTGLFCLGGLLSYPVFKYIWPIHQADWGLDYTSIMTISVVVIYTLPLAHLLWCSARRGTGSAAPGSVSSTSPLT